MFLQHVKRLVKPLYQKVDTTQQLPAPNTAPGLHSTPPGQYPENGPKPSKLGVLFYMMSVLFCIIGIFVLCRYPFMQDEYKVQVFYVGLPLIALGLICLVITNSITDKENRAFVRYLELKVEQYMAQHKRNIQSIPPDEPLQDV